MKITPLDLQHQRFSKKLRGYDPEQVDQVLLDVQQEWEKTLRDLRNHEDEVRQLQRVVGVYREKEASLKQTLISAQEVSQEIKKNAHKETQLMFEQAQMQADKMLRQAHERLKEMIVQIQDIKRQKADFEGQLKGMIESHFKLLKMSEDETKEKNLEDVSVLTKRF